MAMAGSRTVIPGNTRGKYSDDLVSPSRSFSTASLQMGFLPARRYVCALLSVIACPSVRTFICLSQVGVVPKRLYIGARKQRCTIAQGLCSFMMQKISTKFWWNHPNGGTKCRRGR